MPRRTDLKKVMLIGSGPIIIGQAAEFDFSGSQACRALREEGFETVLVNSNPATIQTDLEMADRIYIEPLNAATLGRIIERERPQGILSGMGGQTALNLCSELAESGVLDRYGVELLGSTREAIKAAEDRDEFRKTMERIGEPVPRSEACSSLAEAPDIIKRVGGYPVIVRAAYTLGGTGSGVVRSPEEVESVVGRGLAYSRIGQVLIEESVLGWQEYEYEVVRDGADNCITVCSMENLDPMGIHTGESIVIAPAQTLSDRDHQNLRSAALKIIRALGIAGGCNIQYAVNPATGDYRVIEVNPRVSRSSALASKATGYPIARVAAKIAVGMNLDEIPNAVTGRTFASFEPALDYVVIKIPRWPFDKFRLADRRIGTQMKSTGEVMAIGRTVEEALMKAVRSLEVDRTGLEPEKWTTTELLAELLEPSDKRLYAIAEALRRSIQPATLADLTKWDPFFIRKIGNIVAAEDDIKKRGLEAGALARAKEMGLSDEYIGRLAGKGEEDVRGARRRNGLRPSYRMVDTCAAEFEARTPYFYSAYETTGAPFTPTRKKGKKVLIVGSGPIRIGQGIEFDYCCVHGVMALREAGHTATIANNNPETVSTDYDISDRLYFEPLTLEDVLEIIEAEEIDGVILQFGGQTSIDLAVPLQKLIERKAIRTRILGTPPDSIDIAEDRERFRVLMQEMGILQAPSGTGFSYDDVKGIAERIGYPVLVRPSYVLGGRGMEIVHNPQELEFYMQTAAKASKNHPVLVDKYLFHAIEVDVDAVSDGRDTFIGALMEHIEEAGVHSGDAACVIPPPTLTPAIQDEIRRVTHAICSRLGVVGLVNMQLAVKDGRVYVLETNPRASRTVPFVSKAVGVPLAKVATRVMLGERLADMGLAPNPQSKIQNPKSVSVKAPVFPFLKLPGVDAVLGPEMKSTGEVMGIDSTLGKAYYKAMLAAGNELPLEGAVYLTVNDEDKAAMLPVARRLRELGLSLYGTRGTAAYLRENGVDITTLWRIGEKRTPNALEMMRSGEVKLIINTPTEGSGPRRDGFMMRRLAVDMGIPFISTVSAAKAAAEAISEAKKGGTAVGTVREYLGEREQSSWTAPRKVDNQNRD